MCIRDSHRPQPFLFIVKDAWKPFISSRNGLCQVDSLTAPPANATQREATRSRALRGKDQSSQHGTLNRSRFLLAPPTIPRQFSFLSATPTTFRRLPQERVGLNCAHVPRSPSLWRVQARFRHACPYPNAFRQTGQGVTLLGLTPRHSCHPISQYGRGASARETSGRIACNRTCVCVRLATD